MSVLFCTFRNGGQLKKKKKKQQLPLILHLGDYLIGANQPVAPGYFV